MILNEAKEFMLGNLYQDCSYVRLTTIYLCCHKGVHVIATIPFTRNLHFSSTNYTVKRNGQNAKTATAKKTRPIFQACSNPLHKHVRIFTIDIPTSAFILWLTTPSINKLLKAEKSTRP